MSFRQYRLFLWCSSRAKNLAVRIEFPPWAITPIAWWIAGIFDGLIYYYWIAAVLFSKVDHLVWECQAYNFFQEPPVKWFYYISIVLMLYWPRLNWWQNREWSRECKWDLAEGPKGEAERAICNKIQTTFIIKNKWTSVIGEKKWMNT